MQILEHGQEHERPLLFFPCTAEPVWAFADTITLLSQRWHVFQVVYDGHQPEYPGDFTSVEQTVDEVISYLKSHGVSRLGGAYGCSMGGACLTRMLALGEMPIDRAIIDGGITPYQLLYPVRKLLLWRDIRFIKRYFPKARIHGIPKMAHAELVMVHPEKFCRYAEKFLTMQAEER